MTFALTIKTAGDQAAEVLASRRAGAVITRRAFCLALVQNGILTDGDAIAASKGDWPTALADFLPYLTSDQSTEAQIEWAAVGTVERTHPLVLTLASWIGLSDVQVDEMFGIA